MPAYKLYYFNARGGAEVARLCFAAKDVKYEDVRYSREEWQQHKEEMPMKAMPVLEVDGKKCCQSNAIVRYLARKLELYGSSDEEAFVIDQVNEAFIDVMKDLIKMHFAKDEEKPALMKPLMEDNVPKFLTFVEKKIGENTSSNGFLVASGLTLGDLVLFNGMQILEMVSAMAVAKGTDICKDSPKLKALYKKVGEVPNIKKWVENRPKTDH